MLGSRVGGHYQQGAGVGGGAAAAGAGAGAPITPPARGGGHQLPGNFGGGGPAQGRGVGTAARGGGRLQQASGIVADGVSLGSGGGSSEVTGAGRGAAGPTRHVMNIPSALAFDVPAHKRPGAAVGGGNKARALANTRKKRRVHTGGTRL